MSSMHAHVVQSTPRGRAGGAGAAVLAAGFGATVAMWVIGYFGMMGPGLIVGEALFALTGLCLVAAGFLAGRYAGVSAPTGLGVGCVSGVLNLLIIGAIIEGESTAAQLQRVVIWGGAVIVASMALAGGGAAVGRRFVAREVVAQTRAGAWYFYFVCVAAIAVFLLLITGGLVTGLEAGLAVPDWPNTFGHNMLLYPLSQMTGGVYYEHAHRLYGTLVGLTTIALAATLFRYDHRAWLRALGVLALVMVCVQGVLGGLRVTGRLTLSDDPALLSPSTALAIVHGVFGQVVFATIVAIAAMVSPTWREQRSDSKPYPSSFSTLDQRLSVLLVALLLLQLVLGALYRHLNTHFGPTGQTALGILMLHIVLAVVVTALVVLVAGRAWFVHGEQPILRRLGRVLVGLVGVQIVLGIIAVYAVLVRGSEGEAGVFEVAFTTAHQATGALLLAMSTLLALWTYRLIRVQEPAVASMIDGSHRAQRREDVALK